MLGWLSPAQPTKLNPFGDNKMQTVLLEISDDVKDTVLSFLRLLPSDAVKILEYDDMTFTPEDEINYQTAVAEKEAGDSISLASLKEKYGL